MTNETRNRIRQYTEELPHMKEKVFGALLMLVIATMVTVTSTYAWVTLSRSPEVSHIATSMAANGALEIALSKPDGSQPDEYDIDESLLVDNSVTITNLQWGNLVNLSDASYGIDNMALRPAQLNTTSLLTSPLWGAAYGEDGRITNLDSNYAYAKYNGTQFLTSNEYGVRAIATYKAEISDSTQQAYNEKVQAVMNARTNVNQTYSAVAPKFSALGTMISKYAQNKLDDGFTDLGPYIKDMLPLYEAVRDTMEAQMEAYVALANLQNYLYTNATGGTYTALTWTDLVNNKAQYNTASADQESSSGVISLVGLTQFISDYNLLLNDIFYLEQYLADYNANGSPYYWGGYRQETQTKTNEDGTTSEVTVNIYDNSVSGYTLSNIVAHLIDYGTMTIDLDNTGVETKVTGLGMDNAGSLAGANGEERRCYIYNGILFRLEQSSIDESYRINGNASCTINVKYIVSITIYGKAYTKASGACTFMENYTASLKVELVPNDAVAQDTYGLAIDLWVRTNAEQTCLTLEGATSTDEQGNIVSYDGVNRVWGATGEAMLTTDSTTQGGGSCYIYYADTPEDMARSLELLDAMKVAFVDSNGTLLATAEMDTAHPWAVNGRVTVPLVLDNQTKTTYNYVDSMNAEQIGRAITTLYTDLPIRVTAIVYLDGTRLTNDHVLAAAEIQGSLNIQFGSSLELKTLGSNELIDDTRTVTATVSPTELDYDTAKVEADLTTSIIVNVEGVDPSEVTAFFVRAINSTQGTREKTMTFTKQSNGTWACDYLFTAPGTYYLRHVRLDGVDYTLADPQKVEVAGFGLNSVTWSEASDNVVVRTSDGSHSTSVTVQFASNDRSKLPTSVQARFVRDDGNTVNVPLTYNANGNWVGTGTFTASGVYKLEYLVANGNRYIDLALLDGTYRTMDLSLGMYVTVTDLSGGLVQEFEEGNTYSKNVEVHVYNNADVEIKELEDLVLRFSNGASVSNAISTNLTWDDTNHFYAGTLPITRPGRYQFLSVEVGGNLLTKCPDSPTYIVISPNPPEFDVSSECTLNVDGIQYVPLTNDAKINGIVINNAESAAASAVVYSAVTGEYYDVSMVFTGNAWYVALPTYDGEQIGTDSEGNPIYEQEQDGVWNLVAIRLWECYDANTTYHDETNPILWVDSTLGQAYLDVLGDDVSADATCDFSKLATEVSGKVIVSMDEGTTDLGNSNTAFGTVFHPAQTNMVVTVTDGAGRPIPKDIDVTLEVVYSGNSDVAYGYEVDASATYKIKLNKITEEETGERTVSGVEIESFKGDIDTSWKYVGVYTVKGLTVSVGNEKYAGTIPGVPEKYTVTTAAPTAANVHLTAASLGKTSYGLDLTGNVTGTFLQTHNMNNTYVEVSIASENGAASMNSAVVDGLSVAMTLKHQQNSSSTYGGYTFAGDPFTGTPFNSSTAYPTLTVSLAATADAPGVYKASAAQTLLAGSYTPGAVVVTVGSSTESTDLSEILSADKLETIKVYSMKPDLKITGVSPTTAVTVSTNDDPSTNYLTANNTATFAATNRYDTTNGSWAVVYMGYAEGASGMKHQEACDQVTSTGDSNSNYANFTQPGIKFLLSKGGDETAYIVEPGVGTGTVALKNDEESAEISIGNIAVDESGWIDSHFNWNTVSSYCYVSYTTEAATLLGTVTIEEVTSTAGVATYYRTLENPITISQPNQEDPTLEWDADGVTIAVDYAGTTYSDTYDFPAMAELTATVTAKFGCHDPYLEEPEGAYDWTEVSTDTTTAVYTFKMPLGNATLIGKAEKYPTVSFRSANYAKVTMTATVDGKTETLVSGTTGVRPGETVTVTVERQSNYCKPTLVKPDGVENWAASTGDFTSTYTFTMPDAAVTFADPETEPMYTVSWTNTGVLAFSVVDNDLPSGEDVISSGGYVVPGHELTIRLDIVDGSGGVDPTLTNPTGWSDSNLNTTWAEYTYTMPKDNVVLEGKALANPALTFGTSYTGVQIAVKDAAADRTLSEAGSVNIKEGNTVEITLTALDGYYAPRLDLSGSGLTVTKTEAAETATYKFAMPGVDVDARAITVTPVTVTYNANGGSVDTTTATYAGTALKLPTPTRTGYKFLGWYTAGGTKIGDAGATYTPEDKANVTLYAQWNGYVVTYNANGGSCSTPSQTYAGTALTLPTATRSSYSFKGWYTATSGGTKIGDAGATYTPTADIALYAQWSWNGCVTPETLITLANGTQVMIKDIKGDEMLLVWNHYTGEIDVAPVLAVTDHYGVVEDVLVTTLCFSDGNNVEMIGEHVFFDYDVGRYVAITSNNVHEYVGHKFAMLSSNGSDLGQVELVGYTEEVRETGVYEVNTVEHFVCFTNGVLSAAAFDDLFLNCYAFTGENLMFSEELIKADVEKYGLYIYEDFAEYLSEELFYAFDLGKLKISVGKGYTTWERIVEICNIVMNANVDMGN